MIRNKKFLKVVSFFLVFNILYSTFLPTAVFALTSGYTQPEFSTFETIGTTDMVNLATGDFTFNIPLIDIPGPEGGMTLPLFYHAGIGLEQDASWVGLGWNINPGAITRSINQYPDDAKGSVGATNNPAKDLLSITTHADGVKFHTDNFLLYQRNWDSERGHGGRVSLLGVIQFSFQDGEITSGQVLGIGNEHSGGKGVTFSAEDFTRDVITIASIASIYDAPEAIGSELSAEALNTIRNIGDLAYNASVTAVTAYSNSRLSVNSGSYMSGWQMHMNTKHGHRRSGQWLLDQTRTEEMYGSLYLGDIINSPIQPYNNSFLCGPTTDWAGRRCPGLGTDNSNYSDVEQFHHYTPDGSAIQQQAGSDMHTYIKDNNYALNANPTSIAYDQFSVMGDNVSGNIQPFRLETGTLSFPKRMSKLENKFNLVPFLTNDGTSSNNYKVNFRYPDFSNNYEYPEGQSNTMGGFNVYSGSNASAGARNGLFYEITDPTLTNSAQRKESARYGLTSDRLIGGKHIEWFSNKEILSGEPINKGKFLDFLSLNERNSWRYSLPKDGIGAFSITREDGMTYHYSLPVYNLSYYSKSYSQNDPNNTINELTMNSPFAVEWLLTGITGADFVDRGGTDGAANGIVDDQDWGYWVKLDYGKFSSDFMWRSSYIEGGEYSESDINQRGYTEGTKETYYLNTIKTRSHTALFIKDGRMDAKGYCSNRYVSPGGPLMTPASSLKLSEVVILSNENYNKLTMGSTLLNGANPFSQASGLGLYSVFKDNPDAVIDVNDVNIQANGKYRDFIDSYCLKSIKFNYDNSLCKNVPNSFITNPNQSSPVILPPYGDPTRGKLTLNSISVFGPKQGIFINKQGPDYNFFYASNPNYDPNKWDGWGMYNSFGTATKDGHRPYKYNNPLDGTAWSLTKIITPLGSTIEIDYERDSYSKICEFPIKFKIDIYDSWLDAGAGTHLVMDNDVLSKFLSVGDKITVNASQTWGGCYNSSQNGTTYVNGDFYISEIRNNQNETFSSPSIAVVGGLPAGGGDNCSIEGRASGTFTAELNYCYGGDIRVSQIKISDGISNSGNVYKTRYIYTQNGESSGVTSGVVSKEPPFISSFQNGGYTDLYNLFDLPSTPVLYKKVTVLNGKLTTDSDYENKVEYNFQTPESGMVEVNQTIPGSLVNQQLGYSIAEGNGENIVWRSAFMKRQNFELGITVSKIGKLNSVVTYDKNNTIVDQTNINYTNSSFQGIVKEGTILCEQEYNLDLSTNPETRDYWERLFRTTKTYIPTIASSITKTSNNVTSEVKNVNYDFLTGQILEVESTNSLGIRYSTVSIPAYEKYALMGPKAYSTDIEKNKNMLSQQTGQYVYKKNMGALSETAVTITNSVTGNRRTYSTNLGSYILPPAYHINSLAILKVNGIVDSKRISKIALDRKSFEFFEDISTSALTTTSQDKFQYSGDALIAASIQTWSNDWNIRNYNSSADLYDNNPVQTSLSPNNKGYWIWRKNGGFVWNSPNLNSDGSYANFIDFDWSLNSDNSKWLKTGEIKNYDEFSKPLEQKDVNGNFSSLKFGYNKNNVIAIAEASYAELAYSGAEDQLVNGFFGGEVKAGDGIVVSDKSHTGSNSLQITNGTGFIYKAKVGSLAGSILRNKMYRISAWVYDDVNAAAGKLYYTIKNKPTIYGDLSITSTTIKAGKWNLLNFDFSLTSSAIVNEDILEVGCKNTTTNPVFFDDFRFHPLDASVTSYVYDEINRVTHVLDKDNFYVRYAFDPRNRLDAMYKESTKKSSGEYMVKKYSYNLANDPH